jgi:hypothetical protein
MSNQASWSAFWKLAAIVGGVAVLLFAAAIVMLQPWSPMDIRRGWTSPPFGTAELDALEHGSDAKKFDDESRFMLVASGDMSLDAIGFQKVLREDTLASLVQGHAMERGPWIIGTLDGRPSFVLELPHNFRAPTGNSHFGYLIKPTRNDDGTITLNLSDPTR